MSTPTNDPQSALKFIWERYRVWAATSRAAQADLQRWRRIVLITGVAGAIIGTLSTQQSVMAFVAPAENVREPLVKALGLISAGLLALTTYFTKQVLSTENERRWIRARAAAEAFKREGFLLAAQAPPYDTPIGQTWRDRAAKISKEVEDLKEESIDEAESRKNMPEVPLTAEKYIEKRVENQITYYQDTAAKHRRIADRIKSASLWLGALAVVLGLLGTVWQSAPAFVAVITTVTTALATYLYAGHYEYLVVSYQATARKLKELVVTWEYSGKTVEAWKQFVLNCEGTFAAENSAWMAEWTKPKAQEQGDTSAPASGTQPGSKEDGGDEGGKGAEDEGEGAAPTGPGGDNV